MMRSDLTFLSYIV